MKSPLISVENLCMRFDEKEALCNVSFKIRRGEILGVIGRSGAGKTVLMHLMRGLDQPPSSGRIIYHFSGCETCSYLDPREVDGILCPRCGRRLVSMDIDLWDERNEVLKREVMRRSAIMFQRTFALYGNDRVIENVLHALDSIEYSPETSITRAIELIDQVKLSHRMMHIARDLSGGEKQRVVLARQLAKEPAVLFADEPTGTLDPVTSDLVHEMLVQAVKENSMSMMITSHFSKVIEDVADRAMLLTDGKIAAIGPPREIIRSFLKDRGEAEEYQECSTGNKILIARDVIKKYMTLDRGVVKAVNDVSFDVSEKEILGIVGASGAGKTTLSRIMAGIIEPTSGEMNIRIGDAWIDMTKPGIDQRGRAKEYIGLLHQEYDLYPHRTVLDNLTDAIGLEFPRELAVHKAVLTLQMAGFTEAKSQEILRSYPSQLSEGERHRVALAQVLIREPRMVILDEPTGTMDPITKMDVKHSIQQARQEMEETFIVVSHDMEFVRDICDRLILMQGGKVIQIGRTADVLAWLESRKLERKERSAAS